MFNNVVKDSQELFRTSSMKSYTTSSAQCPLCKGLRKPRLASNTAVAKGDTVLVTLLPPYQSSHARSVGM